MKRLHPITILILFASLIVSSCIFESPWLTIPSLIISVAICILIKIFNPKEFVLYLVIIALLGITNPIFRSEGNTILFYLFGIEFTLESILKGMSVGVQIVSIIYWFKIQNEYLKDEKLLYLFRKTPKIAVFISMTLRLIPYLKRKFTEIREVKKANAVENAEFLENLKDTLDSFNQLITFALEFAVEIGTNMKARGFENKNKTYVHKYKIRIKDFLIIGIVIISFTALIIFKDKLL